MRLCPKHKINKSSIPREDSTNGTLWVGPTTDKDHLNIKHNQQASKPNQAKKTEDVDIINR